MTAIDIATTAAGRPGDHEYRDGVLEIAGGLALRHGGEVTPARAAFRLAGRRDAPVVAVMGGISAGRVVFGPESEPGWWQGIVGPGCPLDTDRFRVLGLDFLGGSHATSGPRPGERFPSVSSFDQAELLRRVIDHLGIERLAACAGASYGGMVTLAFAQSHPQRLDAAVVVSAAHRTHPMSTAWRSVQRAIVLYALSHDEGARGLALARALAMATYRSAREFEDRFAGPPEPGSDGFRFPVESYLMARGASYAATYRPEAFVCLSESIDLHRVDPARIRVPVTALAVAEDQIVPLADMRAMRDELAGGCRLVEIGSAYGHDAFLKEKDVLRDLFAQALENP